MSVADRWLLPRLASFLHRGIGAVSLGDRRHTRRAGATRAAPRIALFGNFGTGNTGNESSLAAMVRTLERIRPDARLTCICYQPEIVAPDHRIVALPIRWQGFRNPAWRILNRLLLRVPAEVVRIGRMIGTLRNIDVMVLPGTGSLDDFGVAPFEWPFDLFKWCVAAKLCGVRTAFVSVGAGPIKAPLSRWFMKTAAQTAVYRSYRDDLSKEFMAGIGLDTHADHVFPDLVFSVANPSCAAEPRDGRPCVGVGVMSYQGWRHDAETVSPIYQRYLADMKRFVLWLGERGYRVRLLGGDERDGAAHDDLLVMLRAHGGRQLDDWLSVEPAHTLDQLLDQISATELVVATRFHNVLCALMLAKPTISVGYARKNDVLMESMGLGAYCQQIDGLDVDRLIAQFEALATGKSALSDGLRRQAQKQRQALQQQERLLAARLF